MWITKLKCYWLTQNCYLYIQEAFSAKHYQFQVCYYSSNMGKRTKQTKKQNLDIRTFPIHKGKPFQASLSSFIKMLEEHHQHLPYRQFIGEVHHFIARFRLKNKAKELAVGAAKQKIRICRKCQGWSGKKHMLQCTLCEDYYHQDCLNNKDSFDEKGLCLNCEDNRIQKFDKNAYLTQLMEDTCGKCQLERQDKEAFAQCLRCSKRFHKRCYGKNVVVCYGCKTQIDQQIKSKENLRQSTLLQFGCSSIKKKVQRNSLAFEPHRAIPKQLDFEKDYKIYDDETRASGLKDLFYYNLQPLEQSQIQHYKQNLMFAILAKKMKHTQKLIPIECELETNTEESLDFGLDHMSRSELQIYHEYKKQPIGPFKFVFKEGMGYDVVADKEIREKTLICQYIGEVVTLRKCIELEADSKNDSLMELQAGCNCDETLIIRPQQFTNMARFINGINNTKSKNKANVATVRKLARGKPTVILYSIRNISKGESLLYDYNAGKTTCQYDTSNFL